MRVWIPAVAALAVVTTAVVGLNAHDESPSGLAPGTVPDIWPTPQQLERLGDDAALSGDALVFADDSADRPTVDLVRQSLFDGGATEVEVVPPDSDREASIVVRLRRDPAPPAEGYEIAVRPGEVLITSSDAAGGYHAAQTFWQLVQPGSIPGVRIVDRPSLPVRGIVEGFYGLPWTYQEQREMIDFSGKVKFNEYIYAPKDDPYHRDRWRDLYPDQRADELGELAREAAQRHIRFTYALAPGLSVCYSDQGDRDAIADKFRQLHDVGVRSFSLPLDDIDYTRWNCPSDAERYGEAGPAAAAAAQVDLLNYVQREVLPGLDGVGPLQTVPVEYYDVADSPYKKTIREGLDERVVMMWTGAGVTPPAITVPEAEAAAAVWGRKPLVWDNYPVNDYTESAGRLLLGAYAKREPGMGPHLTGITGNPMNQAHASQVALFGVADFTWNDAAYDPARNRHRMALYMGDNDQATAEALETFFDLNNLAPITGEPEIWLPQAPALAAELARFRTTWDSGDRTGAVAGLRPYAQRIADAPALIRDGGTRDGFVSDADVWLHATELWGRAFLATLDGLDGRPEGFDESAALAAEASALQSPPGKNNVQGPVKIGDGVLDVFLASAPDLV
ncbi:beta-N-acetylglucosaminidase domain-containing protein [Saccharothrix hoggarensis]|uniref:Beta-N-acetylglucosaminidase domain-containing protein n=1 Tax=Saccharothrix hoggarensis TaxID=913853 RepID=A0ABW3QYU1_9PSEU